MGKKDDLFSFDMEGAKELDEILKGLPLAMQAKVLRSVHKEAVKEVQEEIIRNAPPGSELPEAVKILSDKQNLSGVTVGIVSTKKVKGFHARFLEYGTQKRTTEEGANRGTMKPEPFIVQAIEGKLEKVIKYVTENYGELIDKYISRENKRVQRKLNK